MKKLDRLKQIVDQFGHEYVQPFIPCHTFNEIQLGVHTFEHKGWGWGLRVDYANGFKQGFNLPFLYDATLKKARKVWKQYGNKLVYIVTKKLESVRLNAVAIPITPEHVLVEWNDKEHRIAQRNMYDNLHNVRRAVFGPGSAVYWQGLMHRVWNPRHAGWWRFDEVYRLAMSTPGVDEITFSVATDGHVVIW